jgi:hypothetical protein
MKTSSSLLVFSMLIAAAASASAQQIYLCAGTAGRAPEYINNVKDALARNCKVMSGGNVTVVQGTSVAKAASTSSSSSSSSASPPTRAAAPSGGTRPDSGPEQRARDSDSRGILESELKKSETRLAELQKEYNNGEPEKQGIEGRNYQRYVDRVAEMKDSITRSQSDVAGLKREISRLPTGN